MRIEEVILPLEDRRPWRPTPDPSVTAMVAAVLEDVRCRGDAAVLEATARFDGYVPASMAALRIGPEELEAAWRGLAEPLRAALQAAAANIRAFHERQREPGYEERESDGTLRALRVQPLERVGVYVPGGRAAYPSSVLMNVVPAVVAGVPEIVVVAPAPGGERSPAVLAAAHLAGATEVWAIGGAQAIGALAYGTESIRPVDKIVGPGNRYVTEAKRQVFGTVAIDGLAGPTEVLVIADGTAPPRFVAADLIAQAEHDPDAEAILVTPDRRMAEAVRAALDELVARSPRAEIVRASLAAHGRIVLVPDLETAVAWANRRAPEHLELLVADPEAWLPKIRHAGAVFLGAATPEPVGDYLAGPNHVLPTGGTARWASPLGVYDFVKRSSVVRYSRERLVRDAAAIVTLAEAEGLVGHADAVRVRLEADA